MPDREKVVNGLKLLAHWPDGLIITDKEKWIKPCCEMAVALLKEHEWNLLTEDDDGIIHGLPGDDGQYLMTDGKDIWIDEYVDGVADGIILDSGRDIREIKAWMYMPELPKTDRR